MEQTGQHSTLQRVESLISWWAMAGVDAAVGDNPIDWLALDERAASPPARSSTETIKAPSTPAAPKIDWPQDIDSVRAMIAEGVPLPGNCFSSQRTLSSGPVKSQWMIVSDVPEADELAEARLSSGASGALLSKMLAAIGVSASDCHWTALATTIPTGNDLPDLALTELASFVTHQIGLVQPDNLIVLGSTASRAMLHLELADARQSLLDINDNGHKMAVLATFHPRTLIARPQTKAQAWKDLQMFTKRDRL